MKISSKHLGLGIMAAAALMAGVAIADNGAPAPGPGMMGAGAMGPGMMMGGGGMAGFDFAAVDTDHDGKISQAEFMAWRADRAKSIDSDGDGKLSVEEIAAMQMKQMQQAATERAQKLVAAFDTDGDGKLSAAEMMTMPAGVFARVDFNHDGFVDQAEIGEARAMLRMMGGPGGHMGGHGHRPHGDWFHGWMPHQGDQGTAPADGTPDEGQGGN